MENLTQKEAKTFGDWGYLAIAKHFHKMCKHESKVLKDKEPEELHQMRVGMRRLRSAIAGFAIAIDLPSTAKEKIVGKVARILGNLRDLDVLGELLKNHYQPLLPPQEQEVLDEGLLLLGKKRKKAFKQVKETLNDEIYLHLKQGFQHWLEQPSYQEIGKIAIAIILPDLLLPQVSKLLLHPGWLVGVKYHQGEIQFTDGLTPEAVEELLNTQGKQLHELRKEAKRSRYQMELFTQFYGDSYQGYLKDIKDIQTVLGDIQDSFVLTEFINSVFELNIEQKMPTLTQELRRNRYQKWQEWEQFQRKFLNRQTRKEFHETICLTRIIS